MRHMNLLPQRRRQDRNREVALLAATRFLSSVLYGFVALTILGVVASVGMWAMSYIGARTAGVGLVVQLAEYNTVREEVARRNFLLRSVDQVGTGRVVWSDVLANLLPLIPPDVTIDTLTIPLKLAPPPDSNTSCTC